MTTPLRKARLEQRKTLAELASAVSCDVGGLSRIERGEQGASPALAEKLAKALGHSVTEMQILYPERYMTDAEKESPAEPEPTHTTYTRATNGDKIGTPLKRRAEDKTVDDKEIA